MQRCYTNYYKSKKEIILIIKNKIKNKEKETATGKRMRQGLYLSFTDKTALLFTNL